MRVEVNLYATLARYVPDSARQGHRTMELREGTTVGELMSQLRIPAEDAKLIFLDGIHADADAELKEGSRVGIFPPVGGG